MNLGRQTSRTRREDVVRDMLLRPSWPGSSAASREDLGGDIEYQFIMIGSAPESEGVRASAYAFNSASWLDQVYGLVRAGQHGDAIDLIYDNLESALEGDLEDVDVLLGMIETDRLSAEEIVAVLIVTLGAKDRLLARQAFIERSHAVLAREEEGVDEVLCGLV